MTLFAAGKHVAYRGRKSFGISRFPPGLSLRPDHFHHLFESWIVLEHSDGLAPGLSVCRILRLGDEKDRHARFEDHEFSQVLVANEYIEMTGTGAGLTQQVRDRRALC